MKAMTKKIFSFSTGENEYFEDKQDKFEVVSCTRKHLICKEHLSVVNNCYAASKSYFGDKDFHRSIDTLKEAFYKTTELVDSPCTKCAVYFRATITESLENIHKEIEKMTSGLFGNKSYKSSCTRAEDILREFEKYRLHDEFKSNESKKRFIGNYLQQKVS